MKLHVFHLKESARHWAVETRVTPDTKGAQQGRRRPGELNMTGEISQAECERDDLYLSPEIERGKWMGRATMLCGQR